MNILAIEFSSPQRSVAVLAQPASLFTPRPEVSSSPPSFTPGGSTASTSPAGQPVPTAPLSGLAEVIESGPNPSSFVQIEQALRECGIEREQIGCIALGIGPGSYTGIRAAIALAQGWQLATGVKLLAISSVEAVVAQSASDGIQDRIGVIIDAQRGEFYLSEWTINAGTWLETGKLRLASRVEIEAAQHAGNLLVGPEVTKWFSRGRIVFPRAAALARLAADRSDFIPGQEIQPIYLRPISFVKAPPSRPLPK